MLRDFGWCWTGASGWGKVVPQGCPGLQDSGRLALGKVVVVGSLLRSLSGGKYEITSTEWANLSIGRSVPRTPLNAGR